MFNRPAGKRLVSEAARRLVFVDRCDVARSKGNGPLQTTVATTGTVKTNAARCFDDDRDYVRTAWHLTVLSSTINYNDVPSQFGMIMSLTLMLIVRRTDVKIGDLP